MGDQDKREIAGHVFSARRFYQQLALGATEPDGLLPFSVLLCERGIYDIKSVDSAVSVDQIWLSGIYAESLKQIEFIDQLREGLVPKSLTVPNNIGFTERFTYTAPQSLIRDSISVVTALGYGHILEEIALKSDLFLCPRCGNKIKKYKAPIDALNEMTSTLTGTAISIHLDSTSERLSTWARNRGMKYTTSASGVCSVFLDSGVSSSDRLRSISSVVNSAWKIPGISLVCRRDSQALATAAKDGYCPRCDTYFTPINRASLTKVFTDNLQVKEALTHADTIILTPKLTLRDLLDSPILGLDFSFEAQLAGVISLLNDLGLSHLSLGTTTDSLGFRDVAKLSVAASLVKGKKAKEKIIINLPGGVFKGDDAIKLRDALRQRGVASAIYIREELLGSISGKDGSAVALPSALREEVPAVNEFDLNNTLRPGEITYLSESQFSFKRGVDSIAKTITNNSLNLSIHTIPLFNAKILSSSVVCHELRLLEPLTKLYAASLDARVYGLTNKDFMIVGSRSPRYVCRGCRGLGVAVSYQSQLPLPLSKPCDVCCGTRCESTIGSCLFRGVSFSTILNRSILQSIEVLSSLPKAKPILEIARELDLLELPLGMPVSLLEPSEVRRLALAAAIIEARPSKPIAIIFEGLHVGLSPAHQTAIIKLRDAALATKSVAWVEIR